MSSPEAKRAKTTTSTRAGDSNVPGTAEAPADNGWLAALHAERLKRRGLAPVMSERDAARARERARERHRVGGDGREGAAVGVALGDATREAGTRGRGGCDRASREREEWGHSIVDV